MADHIYKKIEIVGTSETGVDDAIRNAIARASQTVKYLRWFEVAEIRGDIQGDVPDHWQVTVRIGFTLDH